MSESPTTDQPEPIGEASNKLVGGLTATAMAAEGAVSALRNKGATRAGGGEHEQPPGIDREAEARTAADKTTYSVMLDPKTATKAGPVATMDAWKAAANHLDDQRALKALDLAEARLRQISPDLMNRYDRNRLAGQSRHDAMAHSILETHEDRIRSRARPHGGRTAKPPKADNLLTDRASGPQAPSGPGEAAGSATITGTGWRPWPAVAAPHPHGATTDQWTGPVSANGKPVITAAANAPSTTTAATPMTRIRAAFRR